MKVRAPVPVVISPDCEAPPRVRLPIVLASAVSVEFGTFKVPPATFTFMLPLVLCGAMPTFPVPDTEFVPLVKLKLFAAKLISKEPRLIFFVVILEPVKVVLAPRVMVVLL